MSISIVTTGKRSIPLGILSFSDPAAAQSFIRDEAEGWYMRDEALAAVVFP
jgi:hypothetical protein